MDPSPATTKPGAQKPRQPRRPRAARACESCRLKKNKCDELYPCTFCRNRNVECIYKDLDPSRRRFAPEYVRQLEEQIKSLSERLGSQVKPDVSADSPLSAGVASSTEACDGSFPPDVLDTTRYQIDPPMPVLPRSQTAVQTMPTPSTVSTLAGEQEVFNRHTHSVEFYGSSSAVAILSHAQRSGEGEAPDDAASLVSMHNPAFARSTERVPRRSSCHSSGSITPGRSHFPHCRSFLDTFFATIHYVHPILDKRLFMAQCEALWAMPDHPVSSSLALYYCILSLGALVAVRDDEPIEGLGNLEWSRKFFAISKRCCEKLAMVTDLEMVQCYFFMAKVCQNELNPHWSYMYVGIAVRTALAMGINREPSRDTTKTAAQIRAESRTWWGLYSLETEMSFAMGRPDTLGNDIFHNRRFPPIRDGETPTAEGTVDNQDPPHCAIIKCMVDFSRITRNVCLSIYIHNTALSERVGLAQKIEQDLEQWVDDLPEALRPDRSTRLSGSLKSAKVAQWAKRQKLVLSMRYHNLRILLFGSFLLSSLARERTAVPESVQGIQKCLDSAKQTIEIIYQQYEHNEFFRTWFYNTTYTVFAASIILVYITQEGEAEAPSLLRFVDMAVEILEIMDECVVALQAAKLLRRAKERIERRRLPDPVASDTPLDETVHFNHYWGPLNLLDGGMDFDFSFEIPCFEGAGPMFDEPPGV